ncbi:MAG: hypothetical protein QME81_20495, partial [bacterium]|nr:hypothetical protein [bacterium]
RNLQSKIGLVAARGRAKQTLSATYKATYKGNRVIELGEDIPLPKNKEVLVVIPEQDDDHAWFRTPEWQAKEREADEAIAKGEVKEFDNVEDLIKDLNS